MSIQILELDHRDVHLQPIVQLSVTNVEVTHTFLTKEEIQNIKQYVPQAVAHVPHLCIALSKQGELLGFIGVADQRLEMSSQCARSRHQQTVAKVCDKKL